MEAHPHAARLLFREPAADPDTVAVHREVAARSRAAVMTLFVAEPGSENLAAVLGDEYLDMAWEVIRGVLQGLALWWSEHGSVPRQHLVVTAMNGLWVGLERVQRGVVWSPEPSEAPLSRGSA